MGHCIVGFPRSGYRRHGPTGPFPFPRRIAYDDVIACHEQVLDPDMMEE